MHRVLSFVGVVLTVGGLLCFVIELIGALTVERMPAWYLPLWVLVTAIGVSLLVRASRQADRKIYAKHPELSAPATISAVTHVRTDSDGDRFYNVDLVVQPENHPTYAYRNHRSLTESERATWKPGHVVAVRRQYGSRDLVQIDYSPPPHTRERIQNDPSLAKVRVAELTFAETSTPGPDRANRRRGDLTLLAAAICGMLMTVAVFPRFWPMVAESTFGWMGSSGEERRGLFAEGELQDAAERLSPYINDEVYRIEIEGNYTLTVWELAESGTTKIDQTTVRGDRIYGPAPLAYRPSTVSNADLFSLDSVEWQILPEALETCQRYYEDPSATRTSLSAMAVTGEVVWQVSYEGEYGSFSCTIEANGEVIH